MSEPKSLRLPTALSRLECLKSIQTELKVLSQKTVDDKRHDSKYLDELLAANSIAKLDKSTLSKLSAFIEQVIDVRSVVYVTTANNLDEQVQVMLTKWFCTQVNSRTLMSFRVDSSLLGGFVVKTPKNYYDFSMRAGLEQGRLTLVQAVST